MPEADADRTAAQQTHTDPAPATPDPATPDPATPDPATPGCATHDSGTPDVDSARFRAALGSFVTGVSVMTTEVDGVPHGMTANALSSVSLDPPLVLVCVARDALMAELVARAEVFALSFLGAHQEALSWHFADPDRPLGAVGFDGIPTRTEITGCRILEHVVGFVDCEVVQSVDAGDHVIVIGRVVAAHGDEDVTPLVYLRGAYPPLEG